MSNYKLNEDKMFCDIADGVAVIINSETGIYYGMNKLGTMVYENLVNGVPAERVLETLKSMTDKSDLEENFGFYMTAMIEKGILIKSADNNIQPKIDAEIAKEDGYFLDIREYNAAQELLLADPIHEVKEETGWTPEKDSIGYTKEETKEREKKVEE